MTTETDYKIPMLAIKVQEILKKELAKSDSSAITISINALKEKVGGTYRKSYFVDVIKWFFDASRDGDNYLFSSSQII